MELDLSVHKYVLIYEKKHSMENITHSSKLRILYVNAVTYSNSNWMLALVGKLNMQVRRVG